MLTTGPEAKPARARAAKARPADRITVPAAFDETLAPAQSLMTQALADQLQALIKQLADLMPHVKTPDWEAAVAFRWRRRQSALGVQAWLSPVKHRADLALEDLHHIDDQKHILVRNTRQFVEGRSANNVLLTGSRGTGKSSMIKALLNAFHRQGLRLIEVDKADLVDLPDIVDLVAERPERFVIFCDDLSFEEGEGGYKALKTVLDGSIATQSDNVLVYATSNRRHLMPEYMRENLDTKYTEDGEIHPGETVEEKISLSERFGLWVPFYPFNQDHYLSVVAHWMQQLGADGKQIDKARGDALRFALERGSRSGRVAWQFARDWIGQHGHRRRSRRPA
ncbi:MAG: ATP-binding protein [Betaproteobacteria bacterium]|nr:ATP-binding protein [Pseudomonadota bacterium]NBP34746.1 ATP-binding protein [Betaproteobacteria bacterium]HAB47901.1 AAA family ATPase [Lautropia sp.]NBP38706.1 ATP-binding protein [Betaproteobacteria bacterium]NBQ77833.1 ATP-binding protein [Betaproteobacteria bacterium]